ncbi:MAG: alpha-L-arabinofuranosidase C-terminal domain-containing protein, partial [Verrucomicrobiota bacterium]
EGEGNLDLDVVSLFPERTWKGRPNGLRADLVQMLADLKPGFMRFPGGCIVEGRVLETRYQWKTTGGKPEDRQLIVNRWNDEFKHRPAPDYFQSFGLGFFEFFQMCEDIGAQPLPILNCGMACQFNSGQLAPLDALQPYIQDALDLIEFANGAPDTPWGRVRAQMGHRRPFGMKLLGVGNEQWGPQYIERYTRFAQALKAAHPEIQLISSAGPGPADDKFEFAWPKLRELQADIVDEHCYARPDWFLDNSTRYDRYDRHGPKVFMGEYAAQSVKTVSPDNHNNWECALGEAAYMIGLERNADVVVMSSYAPLFGHVDAWQWTPNLIWFDNLRAYGTPNYYVQQLFARNRGDILLPVRMSGAPHAANDQPRLYASATRDIASSEVILKVVNATPNALVARLDLAGARKVKPRGQAFVLTGSRIDLENSLDEPRRVAPRLEAFAASAVPFDYTFEPTSMTVLRMKVALP